MFQCTLCLTLPALPPLKRISASRGGHCPHLQVAMVIEEPPNSGQGGQTIINLSREASRARGG